MPKTYRLFIAITLPREAQMSLAEIQRRLSPLKAVRWTKFTLIHLTLQFLGDTPTTLLPELSAALTDAVSGLPPFTLSLATVGTFPNLRRPRIVWAGVTQTEMLSNLYHAVTTATASVGIPADKKPFKPHLTIGRVQKWARGDDFRHIAATIEQANIGDIAAFSVEHIALIRSQLTRQGPIYTPEAQISLR